MSTTELAGRRVLVTGAAVRIGRELALALLARGAHVAVHYHRSVEAAQTLRAEAWTSGARCVLVRGDLRQADAPARIVAEAADGLGGLDAVVNNASVFRRTPLDELDDTTWDEHLQVNLTAPLRICRAALPYFEAAGGGKIVNMVDLSALRPWPSYLAHSVSKAGLLALTRGLARALARRGVQVNAVMPGIVLWPDDLDAAERARLRRRIPVGVEGTPQDVVQAVLYLLQASAFVTGTCVVVDGGAHLVDGGQPGGLP